MYLLGLCALVDIACGEFADLVVEPKVEPGLRKADAEDIVGREHRTYVVLTLFHPSSRILNELFACRNDASKGRRL